MTQRRTIHHMLADARARYRRVGPHEALSAMDDDALLIDVRDGDQRRRDGVIPGALAIDLTILLWRVDPDSGASHPGIPGLDTPLILLRKPGVFVEPGRGRAAGSGCHQGDRRGGWFRGLVGRWPARVAPSG